MASSELQVIDHFDQMNKVVSEMLKGNNPTAIANSLKMKRYEVISYLDEWKTLARSSRQIQDRAKDAISGADQHYSMIIHRGWESVEEAEMSGELKNKLAALALIANVEQKRIDMLQKAGLLDNQETIEKQIDIERKQKILEDILREVAQAYPQAKNMILGRLAQVTGEAEGITVPGTVLKTESIE